jgi:threonine dehydrogenase-like Zn-dependent dehydrogenase
MRATILEGERTVSVADVPDPTLPGHDGAVVKVDAAAICGSDLHIYHAASGFEGVRLGHEFIGTVTEVGPDVRSVSAGDRVLVSGVIGCGRCVACLARDPVLCRDATQRGAVFGMSTALPGGQAEAVAVPHMDAFSLRIPSGITDAQAVLLTDILPTGYLGCQRADIRPGSTVMVIGLGPVGLMTLHCLPFFGPGRVIAVDMVAERRARAEAMGAETIDPADGGTMAQVMERTGGWGADSVIEAVGADQTIYDAIMCAAPGSTVSITGASLSMAVPVPMLFTFLRKLTIRATYASVPSTWETLVPLIAAGKLRPDDVFSHHLGLSEVSKAYAMFDGEKATTTKVLLDPSR